MTSRSATRLLRRLAGATAILAVIALTACGPRPATQSGGPDASPSPIPFKDVTQAAGIRFSRVNGAVGQRWMPETIGGGGAFIDYDNDGYPDILLVNGDWWPGHALPGPRPTLALYHNNRNGTFTDVTKDAGLGVSLQGMGAAVGDFDNDGWEDLYITGVGGSRLFRNEGGKRFVDVTQQAGVGDSGWSTSAAWMDYDNDGLLDLFVCHYLKWTPATDVYCGTTEKIYCRPQEYPGESCRLFHNEGKGRFRDVTRQAGLYNPNSKGLGVCIIDLDRDGRQDLIIANDMEPNSVYRNNGNGTFTEIGIASGIALSENGRPRAGMGVDAVDYRNDGNEGLAVGNFFSEGLAFYDITAQAPYADKAKQAGLFQASYPYVTFGLFFADFDNDGLADLFVTNGNIYDNVAKMDPSQTYPQPCLLFRNLGNGRFQDASRQAGAGVTESIIGRGACRGDFDNDGKMDVLLIPCTGPPRLLRNETPTNHHWLSVKLVGASSNRDGYGAVVRVESGGVKQTAVARSGSSYLSANDNRLFFGLGDRAKVDRLSVRWPSGREESWAAPSIDRIVTLTEGTGQTAGK